MTITVKLVGGLGNQLFGYFAGKHVASRLETDLVFDLSQLRFNPHQGSSILDADFFRGERISESASRKNTARLLSRVPRWLLVPDYVATRYLKYFRAKGIGWDPGLSYVRRGSTISGYFQTYKYFVEYSSESGVVQLGPNKPSNWFLEKSEEARCTRPIMVHLRRGDYLNAENKPLGVLSSRYFENSVRQIQTIQEFKESEVWVFSDSPDRSQNELKDLRGNVTFINSPISSSAVESMALMSLGCANIISNSTFSYWSAMFGQTSTTIAPSKWFKAANDPRDLIPPDWLRIDSQWR